MSHCDKMFFVMKHLNTDSQLNIKKKNKSVVLAKNNIAGSQSLTLFLVKMKHKKISLTLNEAKTLNTATDNNLSQLTFS